jgi:HK97 family phage portal protein
MNWFSEIMAARQTREPRHIERERIHPGRPLAGVIVTPDTAVTVPAVWACLRYISQTVASLPWAVMRETEQGGVAARNHPVDWLLRKRPNDEWSPFQFRETLVHWALRWGNGYAEIERDQAGRPWALWPIHPERVEVKRDSETLELYYEVNNGTAGTTRIAPRDMFHIRGFGEGPVGVNVMIYAAESIGWARAAQLFGAAFYGNGMNVGGIVTPKASISPAGKEILEEELRTKFGGVRKAFRWLVGDPGMEVKTLQIEPDKGQFVETNQHLVEEVCRWFGVPPHKVAHLLRSTNNNIEHQSIEVVQDAILPWALRFEQEADFKLFGPQNRLGFYTKMNLRGILRGDFKSQQEGLEVMRRNAIISANEWRDLVDMNEMPAASGGDKYVMQAHNTTLDRIGEEVAPEPPAPPETPDPVEALAMTMIERMAEEMGGVHA